MTLHVKPVYVHLVHRSAYMGPCRGGSWDQLERSYDEMMAAENFEKMKEDLARIYGDQPEIHLQESVYLEFLDEFIVREAQLDLVKDQDTDVFLLDGLMGQHLAVNIARRFRKPMCSVGCCTSTDVTACLRAAGFEAYGSIDLEGTLPVMKLLQCFTEDQWGATMRYHYNRDMGETVTMVRFNPQGTRLLAAKGVIVTETDYDKIGCDTGLLVSVANKGKFFKAQCNYGHHMTWAYGDIADQLEDLGDMLGFQPPPYRFEAGTPNFVGAVGFGEALEYLEDLGGMKAVAREEEQLRDYLWEELSRVPGVELPLGVKPRAGIVSFLLPPFHPYDVAVLLDQQGVAVRSGTHCAQPLLDSMGLSQGTVRVSLGLYNDARDVDRLCAGLRRIAAIKL